MNRWRVVAPLLAAAALPLAVGCSSDSPTATGSSAPASSSTSASSPAGTTPRTAACRPVPAPAESFDWLPADLPLPPGTYATADTESPSTTSEADTDTDAESGDIGSAHRGFLVVKMTVDQFKAFVAQNWPGAGYSLGKGDSEAGEAEGGYRKGDFGGAYRVRDVYCDPTMSELLLTYGKGA